MKSRTEIKGNWLMAATFAEAGEWETAMMVVPDERESASVGLLSRIFAAVAFAEEGLHAEAREFMASDTSENSGVFDALDLGLGRVHLCYGKVCFE